jgi:hypothetical protein
MKITEGRLQGLLKEELERATSRRSRRAAGRPLLESADVADVMAFARAYAGLTTSQRELFEAVVNGDFDQAFGDVGPVREALGGMHPHVDEAFEGFAEHERLNG